MEKKNILLLSNSPQLYFGYSVVFSEVAKAIADTGHNLYYLGMQTFGEPTHYENYTLLGIRNDPWASDSLEEYIEVLDIDIVITALDIWMPNMRYISEIFKKKHHVKWFHHITANTEPLSPYITNNILNADKIIAPSKYNEELLLRGGFRNVEYIPHFVDRDIFKVDKKKRKEYKKLLNLEDKFVFVSVMRNKDLHKNPSSLFKAYKSLLLKHPEAKEKTRLILVCDPKENGGMDLVALRKMLDLEDNVIFPKIKIIDGKTFPALENDPYAIPYSTSIALGREQMSNLFNASDVHVNTSSGESFGLPILESMACGCLQVVHEATTGKELVKESDAGFTVSTEYKYTMQTLSDLSLINIKELDSKLEKSYTDYNKKYIKDMIKNGINHSKNYDKDLVMDKWQDLVMKEDLLRPVNYSTGELGI